MACSVTERTASLIVDPARDIRRYLKEAQELGLRITRVYLTHSHADFVAGHMELAKATGAEIIVNEATKAAFPHKPFKDGDAIAFGKARAVMVTTPEHTHAPARRGAPHRVHEITLNPTSPRRDFQRVRADNQSL